MDQTAKTTPHRINKNTPALFPPRRKSPPDFQPVTFEEIRKEEHTLLNSVNGQWIWSFYEDYHADFIRTFGAQKRRNNPYFYTYFALCFVYWAGMINGKREERARHKGHRQPRRQSGND